MNKTVELVNLWAQYEQQHPQADIDEFCLFYLLQKREKQNQEAFLGGIHPPDMPSIMAKLIGRLAKLHSNYALIALKEAGLGSIDEFLYLNSIKNVMAPKKTEVINSNFNELSSGLLILDRLKNRELISEQEDSEDKRSKRLTLTRKGEAILKDCYKNMSKVNKLFFGKLPEDDMQLCIQLLSSLEVNFAHRWLEDKVKSFELLTKHEVN